MARFFSSVSRTSARNSSDRIEMSGLSSPAAFMMSTISVETTARLTICWIASSRSAALFLPSPGTLLTSAARIAWKKPTSSRMARGLVACGGERERLGQRQHRIRKAPVRALLAFLGRLLGRVVLLERQHPVDGPRHDRQAASAVWPSESSAGR